MQEPCGVTSSKVDECFGSATMKSLALLSPLCLHLWRHQQIAFGLLLILRATCPMEVVARDFVATNADQVMSSLGLPARNRPARECLLELRNELIFLFGSATMKVSMFVRACFLFEPVRGYHLVAGKATCKYCHVSLLACMEAVSMFTYLFLYMYIQWCWCDRCGRTSWGRSAPRRLLGGRRAVYSGADVTRSGHTSWGRSAPRRLLGGRRAVSSDSNKSMFVSAIMHVLERRLRCPCTSSLKPHFSVLQLRFGSSCVCSLSSI